VQPFSCSSISRSRYTRREGQPPPLPPQQAPVHRQGGTPIQQVLVESAGGTAPSGQRQPHRHRLARRDRGRITTA
jgi:hypothetical protein